MSMMFSDLQYCTVNVFVDDLIIFSSDERKHLGDLEEVLKRFAERNMMLNGKKALIAKTQVPCRFSGRHRRNQTHAKEGGYHTKPESTQ